jgi:hypothetical protein
MKKAIFFAFLCLPFYGIAQTETQVRDHYQDINKKIQESIGHGFEGSLYCNEWVTNKNSKSWPAVGTFIETTDFWYDDDPNHLPRQERDPKTVLVKVLVKRRSASLVTNEEYLYKNGKLVFYYSDETEEGNGRETRLYFNAKGIFKSSVKANGKELSVKDLATPEYSDFKPRLTSITKSGRSYQELFIKNMVYQ